MFEQTSESSPCPNLRSSGDFGEHFLYLFFTADGGLDVSYDGVQNVSIGNSPKLFRIRGKLMQSWLVQNLTAADQRLRGLNDSKGRFRFA
jgi:hypothetical protein